MASLTSQPNLKSSIARVFLVALALLTLLTACSKAGPTPAQAGSGPTATPAPSPTPTPRPSPLGPAPEGWTTYLSDLHGFGFHYPRTWAPASFQAAGPAVTILGPGEALQLTVYAEIESGILPLRDRLDQYVRGFQEILPGAAVFEPRDIRLAGGASARQVDMVHAQPEQALRVRLMVAADGLRTFLVTVSGQDLAFDRNATELTGILRSFVFFEPSPFGLPPEETLTMPWNDPITLDPAMSRESRSHFFVAHLFSGLVRFDNSLRVQLDLAESVDVGTGGTVYTFRLRDGITFHDGRPITADDVRYSIERATDRALNSPTAAQYLGDIVGVADKLEGRANNVRGVEVVDARTVRITIDAPKAYFLAKLTYPTAAIVDRETIQGRGFEWWKGPVNGTGPFKLREWRAGEVVLLDRFDGYHTPSGLVHAAFPIRAGIPVQMYEAGLVDVAYVGGSDVDRAQDPSSGLRGQLRAFPQFNVNYIGFDTRKPPFDDPAVRRAFAMAIDRELLIEVVFDGKVEPARGLLPPGLPGYSESLRGIPFAPAEAKRLLSESRVGQGVFPPAVVFTISGTGGTPSDIAFVIDSWRQHLGVEVEVRPLPDDAYFYRLAQEVDNLFEYGWIADYPDPQNFLDVLLHSRSVENNIGGYSNPEFDRLLEAGRIERDPERRMALYRQAEQVLLDDAGIIPLYHSQTYTLVKPRVEGFHISPLGIPALQDVRLVE